MILVVGLLALLAFGMGVYFCAPTLPVILALPASYLVLRLGGAGHGNNLSYSDAFLILAALCALPMLRWSGARRLKGFLILVAVYQITQLFSVLDHPNRYDLIEWLHQIELVDGAILAGYAIVQRHRARTAIASFVGLSAALSVWAMAEFLKHGLKNFGGLPGGLQKNLIGTLFAISVLMAHLNPPWVDLRGRWVRVAKWLCLGGLVASQSRQAMVGLIVAVLFAMIHDHRLGDLRELRRRPAWLMASLIPIGAVVYVTVKGQLHSGSNHDSLNTRSLWYSQALHIWQAYPILGVGERFWYGNLYGLNIQPPNAEVSELATGGTVGLIGFLVLIFGALWLLWRLPSAVGSLAFAVLLLHAIDGQFDVFWVNASGSVPWIVAGMAIGAAHQVDEAEVAARARAAPAAIHPWRRVLTT